MLSSFGDICMLCTYIYTSDWSGSCSEEGPLFEGETLRFLYVEPHRVVRRTQLDKVLIPTLKNTWNNAVKVMEPESCVGHK